MGRGSVGEISAAGLAELMRDSDAASRVQLLDVREEGEHDTASIPGFQLLPLSRYRPEPRDLTGEAG